MKVTCDRKELADALKLAGMVTPTHTTKPILQCARLTATEDRLGVVVNDLAVAMRQTIQQVEVSETGDVVVPAATLAGIVQASGDLTIALEADKHHLHVRGADSQFKIFGYPPDDFPPVVVGDGSDTTTVDAGQLHNLVNKTLFAIARENSRYALNGVLFERDGMNLRLVATDGRRLAMANGDCAGPGGPVNAIVPARALKILTRLVTDHDKILFFAIANNQVHFATDSASLSADLIDGNFPPYQDVVPRNQNRKAVFNVGLLASGVRRAAVLTSEETKGVRMAFSDDGLRLSSHVVEVGESEVTVPIEVYTGEPIEIGVNPAFVLDAVNAVDAGTVTIEMSDPTKPLTVTAGPDYLCVIMPLNL